MFREIHKGSHLLTIYYVSSPGLIAFNEFACFILAHSYEVGTIIIPFL